MRQESSYKEMRKKLEEAHFYRFGDILIRMGYIEKTPETIGLSQIQAQWTIPLSILQSSS